MRGRTFEIRGYRPGDERRILTTFNRVFREECGLHYVDRTVQQWTWQYLDNPEGHRITLAVGEDGTVASQYAGVPVRADTPWGCMRFVHCVDSMTHPEWREGLPAPGLFARTGSAFGDQCLRLGEGLCYGFTVDTASGIGRHPPGYEMMCVVDYLIRDHAVPPLPMPDGIVVRRLDDLPAEVDPLYENVLLDKRCLVRRDHRYLRWRYRDNPDRAAYELWAALRGDHLRGLLVLRRDRGLVPDAATIVELMAAESDREALAALVAAATERQRAVGRQRLLAVFPQWSHEWRTLQQFGFEVAPSANWLQRRLVHSIHSHRLTPGFLATNWWFTLGDSDLA